MNPTKNFRQITAAIVLLTSFSMCDDAEDMPDKIKARAKEFPVLDSAVFVKTIPLFSQWDLSCGSCNWEDSLSNFNSLTPTYTGPNRNQCGHADAGCVAVAMGQILYYWQRPGSIEWSKVKDTCSTRETAKLMRLVGESLDMMYNVDQSGSSGIPFNEVDRITNAFQEFQFTAEHGDFDFSKAIEELDNNRPIILIACSDLFCHAWITTAYGIDSKSEYHFYMNWGTGASEWSSAKEWIGGRSVFNRKKTMVYNIAPL
jgi:hypothetical protein